MPAPAGGIRETRKRTKVRDLLITQRSRGLAECFKYDYGFTDEGIASSPQHIVQKPDARHLLPGRQSGVSYRQFLSLP